MSQVAQPLGDNNIALKYARTEARRSKSTRSGGASRTHGRVGVLDFTSAFQAGRRADPVWNVRRVPVPQRYSRRLLPEAFDRVGESRMTTTYDRSLGNLSCSNYPEDMGCVSVAMEADFDFVPQRRLSKDDVCAEATAELKKRAESL